MKYGLFSKKKQKKNLHFSDFCEIDKCRFLGANFDYLRRSHHKLLLFTHNWIGVFILDDIVDSLQELIIGVISILVGPCSGVSRIVFYKNIWYWKLSVCFFKKIKRYEKMEKENCMYFYNLHMAHILYILNNMNLK